MNSRTRIAAALAMMVAAVAASPAFAQDGTTVVQYDKFQKDGGYTAADYSAKWGNPFGPGEGTKDFNGGTFNVDATPYTTGADFSVFDHLKYIAISNAAFPVPRDGSVTFSSDIRATTPGTVDGLLQNGVYGPPGSWTDPGAPQPAGFEPYQARVLQGQQAGAVMNVVDFCTGQLFDWFVAGNTAFALIERLPSNVTGNTSNPNCPGATHVGRDKMYTQIIKEVRVAANSRHRVEIAYTRKKHDATVEFRLNGKKVTKVNQVGVPLDQQHQKYTGIYPSLGPGERLYDQIGSFALGHGLFSLIDGFPYQHAESPELSVSIPVGSSNPADAGNARLFGQGAEASFDNFAVTTTVDDDG